MKMRINFLCCVLRQTFLQRRDYNAAAQRSICHTSFFINDKQYADEVIEASGLTESSDRHKVVIFHVNPGNSVLLESLLKSCDHKQIAWEPRRLYENYLQSLTEVYKSKFAYCGKSFVGDSRLKILDEVLRDDQNNDYSMFHAKIVGNVLRMNALIPQLVWSFGRNPKLCLSQFGIIEPILIVTGYEYHLMTEANNLWKKTKLVRTAAYEVFFRKELLKTVPLSAFNHVKLKSTHLDYDRENLYVVRLILREDLDSLCRREDLVGIMLLFRVFNNKKVHRVIPAMEHLCPDIGIALLELGISMMDRVCDIPLNMWPKIYHAVKSSSQFNGSPLYHIFHH